VLKDYLADDPRRLADIMLDGISTRISILMPVMRESAEQVLPIFYQEIQRELPALASEDIREQLARRKANAAVVLLVLNQPAAIWPLLHQSDNMRVRSYLIDRLSLLGADPQALVEHLYTSTDADVQRALLLALGSYTVERVSTVVRASLIPKAQEIYLSNPDLGLHAASEWLLRQWREEVWLRKINAAWQANGEKRCCASMDPASVPQNASLPEWYITSQGQTMVVIPGPSIFYMGSPQNALEKSLNDPVHRKRIGRTYSLSNKVVSIEQFRAFDPAYAAPNRSDGSDGLPDLPATGILWYMAAAYCNELSKREGIPPEQWCYERIAATTAEQKLRLQPKPQLSQPDGRTDCQPKRRQSIQRGSAQ